MKKIIFVFLIFTLVSCDIFFPDIEQYENYIYTFNEVWFSNLNEISLWIGKNIPYIGESKGENNWQTPEETRSRPGGDCEDRAVLFIAIARYQLEVKPGVLRITAYNKLNGDKEWGRAVAIYDNLVYETGCVGKPFNLYLRDLSRYYQIEIRSILTYAEALCRAFNDEDTLFFWPPRLNSYNK